MYRCLVFPTAISHDRILRKLGADGICEVEQVENLRLGRHVDLFRQVFVLR